MKRPVIHVALLAVISLVISVATFYAQFPVHQLAADIPFNFHVGAANLDAGTYLVRPVPLPGGALQILNKKNGGGAMVMTHPGPDAKPTDQSKLVFNRYGAEYFLSVVRSADGSLNQQLPMTKVEKEYARSAGTVQTEEVALEKK